MKQKFCFILCCLILVLSTWMFGGMMLAEDNVSIVFSYDGKSFEWNEAEPKVFIHEEILQKHGARKDGKTRAELVEKIVEMGFSFETAFCYVFPNIDKTLEKVCKVVERPKKEAKLEFNPKKHPFFNIIPEQVGLFVDKENLLKQVLSMLKTTNEVKLAVVPNRIEPDDKAEILKKQTYLRSSFSTDFSKSSQNRKDNIDLALKSFDGLTIYPQKVYSFNNITGRRTEKKGYKQANIILNNEYVESFGGGVCQASTTLFNALLLAGAEIVESHPHSLESSYIENGFDAMVNFGSSDLKWKNVGKTPMYIHAFTTNEKVCVEIYGEKNPYYIKRLTEIVETNNLEDIVLEDENLDFGKSFYKTYPKSGSTSKSFLEYYKDGVLVSRKLLRKQTYSAVQGVKIVGTRKNFEDFSQIRQILGDIPQNQTDFTTWQILSH